MKAYGLLRKIELMINSPLHNDREKVDAVHGALYEGDETGD